VHKEETTSQEEVTMNRKNSVLGATLLVGGAALAGEATDYPTFKTIDRDNDGYLSRDEVRAGIPEVLAVFSRVDANMDGQLSPAEYEAAIRLLTTPPSS
jgi:hypothetical protein